MLSPDKSCASARRLSRILVTMLGCRKVAHRKLIFFANMEGQGGRIVGLRQW